MVLYWKNAVGMLEINPFVQVSGLFWKKIGIDVLELAFGSFLPDVLT